MRRLTFWIFFLVACASILFIKHKTELRLSSLNERAPNLYAQSARYHADSLRRYSLGFDFVVADLLWLRLLDKARHKEVEPGKVSWEFAQLDAITTLDRKFERAYPFGAAFLSVFLRDELGARLMLEKWVRYYPTNWRAHYSLGYHLFFEMKQFKPAASHILKSASMRGAPEWLNSLGIRLLSETGSLSQALRMAVSLYPALRDEMGKERLRFRVRSLIYALQKASWEAAAESYRTEMKKEPDGLTALIPYFGTKTREIASILNGAEIPEDLQAMFAETHAFRYDSKVRKIVPVKPDPALEKAGIYRENKS
jgi:hypothetical protein